MNKYEITIITKEPFDTAQGKDSKEKPVKKEIEDLGGKILSANSLGQKQFIYPIKKENAGFYTVINFEIEPTKVLDLNKKLGLSEEILRHLILVAKAVKTEAAKKKAVKEVKKPFDSAQGKPFEKPAKKAKPVKKEVKKPAPLPVTKATKEIEEEEISSEERLKALDKKLDELLKE